MNIVDKLQEDRTVYYGDYSDIIGFRVEVMNMIKKYNDAAVRKHGHPQLTPEQFMILSDVVSKLSRIVAYPTHEDSCLDCESYMNLYNKYNGFYKDNDGTR